jgi:N,N'-diacetyllegionaminate synthase|tara:strand:- start:1369 stop:2394 length:1026 start_codon:yes stop_codon:yes gene_type:complete
MLKNNIKLKFNKSIGNKSPCFIIAEIGINHNGDYSLLKKMIKTFAKCGADAIKIQTINPYKSYVEGTKSFKEFQNKDFSENQLLNLKRYADKNSVILFSTPGDLDSLYKIKRCNFDIIKVSSGLLTNHLLLKEILKTKKPVIISTGLAFKKEIDEVFKMCSLSKTKFALLKCTALYPSKDYQLNLNSIQSMISEYNVPIGYSDHTKDELSSLVAVAKGAKIIEKHVTFNKKLKGADHKISIEPNDFKVMVSKIRRIESALGSNLISPVDEEINVRRERHRCLICIRDIKPGDVFSLKNISLKRPLKNKYGLSSKFLNNILYKTSKSFIKVDSPILMRDIKK